MAIRKSLILISVLLLAIQFAVACVPYAAYAADEEYGYDLDGEFQARIIYKYHIKYASGLYFDYEVYFDKDYYNEIANPTVLFSSLKETFIKNGFTVECDLKNGSMVASLSFDTIDDYYYSNGYDGYEKNETVKPVKKTFWYNYYESKQKTVFAGLKTEGRYVNRIYTVLNENGIEDDKILLTYEYGTPYNKNTINSNADEIKPSTSSKLYYHIFNMTVDEMDKEITISQKSVNTTLWYFLAIAAGCVVTVIPLVIALSKRSKEKKYGR